MNKYANEINSILNEKYKTGFATRAMFHTYLKESIEITEENIEDFFTSRVKKKEEEPIKESTQERLDKIPNLTKQLDGLSDINVDEVSEYKIVVEENENAINEIGGEDKFFEF